MFVTVGVKTVIRRRAVVFSAGFGYNNFQLIRGDHSVKQKQCEKKNRKHTDRKKLAIRILAAVCAALIAASAFAMLR